MDLFTYHSGHYEPPRECQSFVSAVIDHAWIIANPGLQQLLGRAGRFELLQVNVSGVWRRISRRK